jgi:hypothetical protein
MGLKEVHVEHKRFDAWTRRRFGLAATGTFAALLGFTSSPSTEAKQGKKRCRKLGETCDNTKKRKSCCASELLCAQVSQVGQANVCCRQAGQACSSSRECCGNDGCDAATGKCRVP